MYRVCTFRGPLKIGDEGGEEVMNDITNTTINNLFVKNNGYGKGGNKRLYIILRLQYRNDVFAFYVD